MVVLVALTEYLSLEKVCYFCATTQRLQIFLFWRIRMSNELTVINEQEVLGKQFRLYGTLDEPLFLAKDVAEWIEHSDVSMMLKKIDDDEKLIQTMFASGQNREMWFLTENGLYEVLMQSRKPIAKEFKKKVKEILKTIRKTGTYKVPRTYKEALQQLLLQVEENERLQLENQEMKPKAEFFDAVADSKTAISMNEVAKVLNVKGYGRNKLFEFLRNEGILDRYNIPYQRYVDNDWFRVIEQTYTRNGEKQVATKTLVYQKGVDGIRKKLNEKMERLVIL